MICISLGCCSAAESCLTVCDPMNHSTPGFPVHHQLPEFTQTHVHRVSAAIQPSHPLSSPLPAFNFSQHQGQFFTSGGQSIGASASASVLPSNEYSGLISFRIDWFDLFVVYGTLKSLHRYDSLKPWILWCSAFFMVHLSHPYMTTGKKRNFDYTDLCKQCCSCLLIGCLGLS